MKNLKLLLFASMLFLGMGSVVAQTKSMVIIIGNYNYGGSKYEIEIVKPDYVTERKEKNEKTEPFFASVKKEVDVWLNQGYKISEVTSNAATSKERFLFVLIKEE